MYYKINRIDKIFVPRKFEIYVKDKNLEFFTSENLTYTKVFQCLKNKGVALLEGDWDKVLSLYKAIDKQKKELVGSEVLKNRNIYYRNKCFKAVENSIMLRVKGNALQVTPPRQIPFLFNLCGEAEDGTKEKNFLIPVADYLKINYGLEHKFPIAALDDVLFAHYNVLPPQSQQTNNLAARALQSLQSTIKAVPCILDLGCGSGVMLFIAARIFPGARLYATDLLVEALGTTAVNALYLQEKGKITPGALIITKGGDLFDSLPAEEKFDLIIFNAPWVYARAKSIPEKAINDEGFSTIKKFLDKSRNRLFKDGHVILCSSNHAGDKTGTELEKLFMEYGFFVNNLFKDKIQSRMKTKKWVTIYVYDLSCRDMNQASTGNEVPDYPCL